MIDLVIKNGRLVTVQGVLDAGLAIDEGRIVAIAKGPNLPRARKTIDAKGKHILPGIIEPHSHLGMNNPFDLRQDAITETAAAACGGITTYMHMLIDSGSYKLRIPESVDVCRSNSTIDVAFIATIMNDLHVDEIPDYVKLGVTSFKHFMNRPEYEQKGQHSINIQHPDDGLLFASFERIRDAGGLAKVHCENYELIRRITERVRASGRIGLAAWDDSRPDFCEQDHLMRAGFMAKLTGVPLYAVHTSVEAHRELVDWARREGVEIYIETCTSYLTFTRDSSIGVVGKVNPPLRTERHQEALWRSVKDGHVHCIGTDHASIKRKKKIGNGDIWSAWTGFVGSELMLPLMLSEGFHKRGVPLERIVEVCSYNTARIHGIPNKGDIRVGYDGDLVLVDLKRRMKVSTDILHGSSDFTPWDGWEITGWPVMTILRGNVVAEEGRIIGRPGFGEFVTCTPRTAGRNGNRTALE